MKKLVLILCTLFVAQVAFGALDRDHFDYTDTPEYQAIPTTQYQKPTPTYTPVSADAQNGGVVEEVVTTKKTVTQKGKRRFRFRNEGSSWVNTYWNFGQPVYGETGRF